ncbi:hypothetical protein UFOVP469_40 [uncultured Caudovirales phage]|uniref:DUF2786 domain-containing protein n=1 Tax=uncultured Caudovirales phage TaxID=2100421 RepID=A0A6J5MHL6_9CAUD|nr:hypothetical protein UFOVP469_40 [uncultured Caudovirales phage]CAB4189713.1 hypothetical protein UFOVP1200_13 [uncultured Caudovirales phage]
MSVDIQKLAKVLALMSSPQDGEALAAARLAHTLVQKSGLSWEQLLTVPDGMVGPLQTIYGRDGVPLIPPIGSTWRQSIDWLCARRAGRSLPEEHMLDRLSAEARRQPDVIPVSARQARIILDIYRTLSNQGGAA